MKEVKGNILQEIAKGTHESILLVTTNGYFSSKGVNVMGAGFAKAVLDRIPGIDSTLGTILKVQHMRLKRMENADTEEPWNIPYKIGTYKILDKHKTTHIFSFPTKPTRVMVRKETVLPRFYSTSRIGETVEGWKAYSQLPLIERSAKFIRDFIDESPLIERVLSVRPGCSNGGLDWESQVRPVLEPYFDDRFIIMER